MSKKDKNVSDVVDEVVVAEPEVTESEAEKLEKFKAQKREAAKRFKERRNEEKAARIEGAKKFIEDMKAAGHWDEFTAEQKTFIESLVSTPAARNNSSTFTKLFGDSPKVGDTISLTDVFNKTGKGYATINTLVKKWAKSGTIVKVTVDSQNILNTTYAIEAIGSAPVDAE